MTKDKMKESRFI